MKIVCPVCGKSVDTNKWGKVVAHKDGNVQCRGAGKRVEQIKEKK